MGKLTYEPMLWLLFSAGGVMAALLIPILAFLFGVAFPLGWIVPPSHGHVLALISHPLTRVILFLLCLLCLLHWAHRFRYTLYDGLQIKHLNEMINPFCYGAAIFGAVVAGYIIWNIP